MKLYPCSIRGYTRQFTQTLESEVLVSTGYASLFVNQLLVDD